MDNTDRAKTVQKPCTHGLQNKKAMKSFDFTAFSGAMEGTRTPGLLIRSQSLYPAELPTHTFRSEHDVFYHAGRFLSTVFCNYFCLFSKRTSFVRFCAVLFRWLVPTPAALAVFLQAISQFKEPLLPSPALCSLHDILRLRRLFRGKMRSKLLNWRFL